MTGTDALPCPPGPRGGEIKFADGAADDDATWLLNPPPRPGHGRTSTSAGARCREHSTKRPRRQSGFRVQVYSDLGQLLGLAADASGGGLHADDASAISGSCADPAAWFHGLQ